MFRRYEVVSVLYDETRATYVITVLDRGIFPRRIVRMFEASGGVIKESLKMDDQYQLVLIKGRRLKRVIAKAIKEFNDENLHVFHSF